MAALTCGYSAAQTYRPRDFASPQVCSRPAPQRALERRLLAPAVAVALANEQAQESGVDGAREAVASSKRLVRLVKGCSSLWQLQQQLSTTPAPATNSFVLAAALTHAAQLSLKQPLSADEAQWCAALAEQATRPANIARCSPRQVANIAWALTQLGPSNGALLSASGGPQQPVTAAPAAWQVLQQEMHGWLLPPAGQELRAPDSDKRATARDVVMALQACAEAPRPMSEMWVIQALTAVSSSWQSLNAQDCAALATALRLLPHTPSEQWVQEYLQHTLHLLPSAPAEAVCRMVWAMPALIAVQTGSAPQHPRAGQGQLSTWRSALFQVLTEPGWAQHPNVSPYHISALLWGLAQLQWQPPAHVTQGLLARVSVVWEQPHNIAQPATPGTSATAAGFVDSTGHVPDRQGAVSVRRLAAQALNSASLLGCTPPQEWVQGALRYVVNSAAPVTHNTWRDLCAVLTSAVQLRYRPDPPLLTGVLQYACACDTDTITPAQWAQLVWCCAKLGYVPHRHLLAGAVQHAADCFAGAHARGGQRVTQKDLCQLLWSVATLEHIAQSSATAAAATAAQQADSDQPAPAEQALPAPVHSQQPARLVPWSCVGRLVALADAAFATHAIEAEHIAEVVWSLSKLSTRQHSLPHSLRSALMSGVAAAAPQLPSKQLLACCIALPRCGCHRVYDRCKLLRAVLPALLPHWADWGAGTVSLVHCLQLVSASDAREHAPLTVRMHTCAYMHARAQVAHVLTALVDMGYVVPQRKLWLMVPRLLENTRLFKPSRAQVSVMHMLCTLATPCTLAVV